jgi:hypothetical protein
VDDGGALLRIEAVEEGRGHGFKTRPWLRQTSRQQSACSYRIPPLPAAFHHEMYRFGLYRRLLRGIVTTPLPVTAWG